MEKTKITKDYLDKNLNGKYPKMIFQLLTVKKKETVNNISSAINLSQSYTSTILNELYYLSILDREQKQKYVEYSLNKKALEKCRKALKDFIKAENELLKKL